MAIPVYRYVQSANHMTEDSIQKLNCPEFSNFNYNSSILTSAKILNTQKSKIWILQGRRRPVWRGAAATTHLLPFTAAAAAAVGYQAPQCPRAATSMHCSPFIAVVIISLSFLIFPSLAFVFAFAIFHPPFHNVSLCCCDCQPLQGGAQDVPFLPHGG